MRTKRAHTNTDFLLSASATAETPAATTAGWKLRQGWEGLFCKTRLQFVCLMVRRPERVAALHSSSSFTLRY